jgi:hypothetical protein
VRAIDSKSAKKVQQRVGFGGWHTELPHGMGKGARNFAVYEMIPDLLIQRR